MKLVQVHAHIPDENSMDVSNLYDEASAKGWENMTNIRPGTPDSAVSGGSANADADKSTFISIGTNTISAEATIAAVNESDKMPTLYRFIIESFNQMKYKRGRQRAVNAECMMDIDSLLHLKCGGQGDERRFVDSHLLDIQSRMGDYTHQTMLETLHPSLQVVRLKLLYILFS